MPKKDYDPIVERVCPVCGKTFVPAPFHRYKENDMNCHVRVMCSWGCLCKYRVQIEAAKAERKAAKARAKASV